MGDMTMPYDPDRHHRRSIRLRGYDYTQPGAYFVTICAHERRCLFGALDGGALRLTDAGRMIERWWGELNRKFPGAQTDAFVIMPDHIHGIIIITAANRIIADRVDPIVGINAGGYADPPPRDDADDSNASNAINATPSVRADLHIRPRRTGNEPNDADVNRAVSIVGINAGGSADPPPRDDGDDFNAGGAINADAGDSIANDTNDTPNRASLFAIVQWFKIMTTNAYIRGVKQSGWPPFRKRVWQRGYWERIVRDERELQATRRYIAENPISWTAGRKQLDALLARMDRKD
jgi:REP element-mobilizing transposase RayT